MGKTGREETGNTEKRGAFRYVVAMETGNAQYLSNAAEVYVSEISKRICPGLIRASGERTYRFFKRAFDLSKDNIVGLVLFLLESVFKMKSARCRNKSHAFACICRSLDWNRDAYRKYTAVLLQRQVRNDGIFCFDVGICKRKTGVF